MEGENNPQSAASQQTRSDEDPPLSLIVEYPTPGQLSVAFPARLLEKGHDEDEIYIPTPLLEREEGGADDDTTLEQDNGDLGEEFFTDDFDKRKRIFTFFLFLDIAYCVLLLLSRLLFEQEQDKVTLVITVILAVNILVNIATLYGTKNNILWILTLFIFIEAISIGFFLFKTFSPLVILRVIVLMLGAQVRTRLLMGHHLETPHTLPV